MKKSIVFFGGFVALSVVFIGTSFIFGNADRLFSDRRDITDVGAETEKVTVVIDAGHGGEDGGCSGEDGTLEKDLNLQIAENVRDILEAAGCKTAMTRDSDEMLYAKYDATQDYTGKKKVNDLKNRIRFTEESGAELLVSIHINKFPDARYSGLQVYFSPETDGSSRLADRIQKYTEKYLQKDNSREIKSSGKNIYILDRSPVPAVLVECGFLSNVEECKKLNDPEYRRKLSLCIATAILDHLQTEEKDNET